MNDTENKKIHVAFDVASARCLDIVAAHLREMGASHGAGAAVRFAVISEAKRILREPRPLTVQIPTS